MNLGQVEALSELLGGQQEEVDYRTSSAPETKNNANAGVDPLFRTVIKSGPTSSQKEAKPSKPKVDSRAIWTPEEVERAKDLLEDDERDGRVKPDYDILYKQSITAEDVFMNLSMKDGSTVHAQAIVVKIPMPGTQSMNEVNLEVTQTRMRVTSNKYKLFLHLPHTVDDQGGRAKWDAKTQTLSVTLPIIKSEDDLY